MIFNEIVLDDVPVLVKDQWKKNVLRPIFLRLELVDKRGKIVESTSCDPKILYGNLCKVGTIEMLDKHPDKYADSDMGQFIIHLGSNKMSELMSIIFSDEIKVEQNPKTSVHLFSGRRFGEVMMKSILSVSFTEFGKYHQYADRYNKILSGEI